MKVAFKTAMNASGVPNILGKLPTLFGVKAGISGAHTTRTMMLAYLTAIPPAAPKDAKREDLNRVSVVEKVQGKRTTSNHWLTGWDLAELCGLDSGITLFPLLRSLWDGGEPSRPMLASPLRSCAGRAPLRLSAATALETNPSDALTSENSVKVFNRERLGRLRESATLSLTQSVRMTWAQAAFLMRKIKGVLIRLFVPPAAAAYAIVLGNLCGLRGHRSANAIGRGLVRLPTGPCIRAFSPRRFVCAQSLLAQFRIFAGNKS